MAEKFVRAVAGELFTLLTHPTLATPDLDDVARAIRKVVNGYENACLPCLPAGRRQAGING